MDVSELIENGDKLNKSGSLGQAIRFYEYDAEEANGRDLSYILPRLTSCYRKQGRPQKAIDILSFASQKFGQSMVTPALLTSAAAAYCDLGDYSRAKKCCDRALAALNGQASAELKSVYARIRKETDR